MNCIDAIEGAAKSIIVKLHQLFAEERLDDTEYIRNVKAVIDGVDVFARDNQEIVSDPKTLKQVLYDFSKDLWLTHLEKNRENAVDSKHTHDTEANDGYDDYYFDHIYGQGMYPR